jgi:hypothetical protein
VRLPVLRTLCLQHCGLNKAGIVRQGNPLCPDLFYVQTYCHCSSGNARVAGHAVLSLNLGNFVSASPPAELLARSHREPAFTGEY